MKIKRGSGCRRGRWQGKRKKDSRGRLGRREERHRAGWGVSLGRLLRSGGLLHFVLVSVAMMPLR